MILRDIYTPEVVCCGPGLPARDAARLMRDRHVGDLVILEEVGDDQTPIGMVTDRDLVVRVLAEGRDPSTCAVREVMRAPVVIACDIEDAATAMERMQRHGVRRIPVMDPNRKLVGIVCLDDLLKQLASDANALVAIVTREQRDERSHTHQKFSAPLSTSTS